MTREELEANAFELRWTPAMRNEPSGGVVPLTDALTYGDSRYREGLEAAAKAMCPPCNAELPWRLGSWWRHAGGVNCSAGPIHDLIAKMEKNK